MFEFTLNQDAVTVAADMNLLEYLREEARLTSVKDGCAEGVCGSCSVLVNGKAWRACKLTLAKVHGKQVTTIEGLSGADAADRLQMPIAQLYVAKNRVQKLLQEEILILRGE